MKPRVMPLVLMGVLCAGGSFGAVPARAASVSTVLPHGAQVQSALRLPGFRGTFAVSFSKGSQTVVGLVSETGPRVALRWAHTFGHGTWKVSCPGPGGLFQGIREKSPSGAQKAFAYVFDGASVTSAIQGQPSGELYGNRGVTTKAGRLAVRRRDATHIGSVRYRFDTRYVWLGRSYVPSTPVHIPDYPSGQEPRPSVSLRATNGSVALIRVQIADTVSTRATGLMNVKSMDPDSGMIFVWPTSVLDPFWMQDTYIPLSIAWIDASLKVVDIQEMTPLDETLHYSRAPYQYAIEANRGYFESNGVEVGDTVQLHLQG